MADRRADQALADRSRWAQEFHERLWHTGPWWECDFRLCLEEGERLGARPIGPESASHRQDRSVDEETP